jgi:hypothetical protein
MERRPWDSDEEQGANDPFPCPIRPEKLGTRTSDRVSIVEHGASQHATDTERLCHNQNAGRSGAWLEDLGKPI